MVRRYDRAKFPAGGVAGGGPGLPSRFVVRYGAEGEEEMPSSGRYDLKAGDRFLLQAAGGGGYGDPRRREAQALNRDIAEDYVTSEAKKRDYGG